MLSLCNYHCHLLANHTEGIKHVYITLITLWMFFDYSPKRSENLEVLNLPELKSQAIRQPLVGS